MATRFYTDPTNAPSVSPAYDGGWSYTDDSSRRKLVIDTAGNNGDGYGAARDVVDGVGSYCLWQFVSEPLDSISATLAVSKGAFRCSESDAKLNGYTRIIFRKCDEDGSNPVTIGTITDDVEYAAPTVTNRFVGASNLTDQALSQGDRLVIEVGFYSSATKDTLNYGYIYATDNHATTDLPENDTETTAYNSWIETGDTFTEASGEPAAIKLGPMFAFA